MELFGGEQGETVGKGQPRLRTEHGAGPGAGAIRFEFSFFQHEPEELMVLKHSNRPSRSKLQRTALGAVPESELSGKTRLGVMESGANARVNHGKKWRGPLACSGERLARDHPARDSSKCESRMKQWTTDHPPVNHERVNLQRAVGLNRRQRSKRRKKRSRWGQAGSPVHRPGEVSGKHENVPPPCFSIVSV